MSTTGIICGYVRDCAASFQPHVEFCPCDKKEKGSGENPHIPAHTRKRLHDTRRIKRALLKLTIAKMRRDA